MQLIEVQNQPDSPRAPVSPQEPEPPDRGAGTSGCSDEEALAFGCAGLGRPWGLQRTPPRACRGEPGGGGTDAGFRASARVRKVRQRPSLVDRLSRGVLSERAGGGLFLLPLGELVGSSLPLAAELEGTGARRAPEDGGRFHLVLVPSPCVHLVLPPPPPASRLPPASVVHRADPLTPGGGPSPPDAPSWGSSALGGTGQGSGSVWPWARSLARRLHPLAARPTRPGSGKRAAGQLSLSSAPHASEAKGTSHPACPSGRGGDPPEAGPARPVQLWGQRPAVSAGPDGPLPAGWGPMPPPRASLGGEMSKAGADPPGMGTGVASVDPGGRCGLGTGRGTGVSIGSREPRPVPLLTWGLPRVTPESCPPAGPCRALSAPACRGRSPRDTCARPPHPWCCFPGAGSGFASRVAAGWAVRVLGVWWETRLEPGTGWSDRARSRGWTRAAPPTGPRGAADSAAGRGEADRSAGDPVHANHGRGPHADTHLPLGGEDGASRTRRELPGSRTPCRVPDSLSPTGPGPVHLGS